MTYKKKLIEVAIPAGEDQHRVGTGEVDPARASVDTASVVGAAAVGGGAGSMIGNRAGSYTQPASARP